MKTEPWLLAAFFLLGIIIGLVCGLDIGYKQMGASAQKRGYGVFDSNQNFIWRAP